MTRPYNFGAGPAVLPEEILLKTQAELLSYQGSGMSIMEMSHRGKPFMAMLEEAENDLRDILSIPANYRVLFMVAPSRAHFSMVPLNLLRGKTKADYLDTGIWSHEAIAEAKRYCSVNVAASSEEGGYKTIPDPSSWRLNSDAAYLYYASNETVNGVEFQDIPDSHGVPLVVDMTSSLLSRPLEIAKFGCIFAGAQKNIAPAGLSIVIIRDDLLGDVLGATPTTYNYTVQAENKSMLYTNATLNCYMAALMFKWVKKQGGVSALFEVNARKARKLYQAIDNSDFYVNDIDKAYRSIMNVVFNLRDPNLLPLFLEEAQKDNLYELKGHRYVGGLRASLYNAMPEAGVDALVNFMDAFAKKYA